MNELRLCCERFWELKKLVNLRCSIFTSLRRNIRRLAFEQNPKILKRNIVLITLSRTIRNNWGLSRDRAQILSSGGKNSNSNKPIFETTQRPGGTATRRRRIYAESRTWSTEEQSIGEIVYCWRTDSVIERVCSDCRHSRLGDKKPTVLQVRYPSSFSKVCRSLV